MSQKGILSIGDPDPEIVSRAKAVKIECSTGEKIEIPFEKTLILKAGTRVPWDLLPAAWNFLNRWDAAVPLWMYGKTAQDVGTALDRKKTAEIVRDLRVLLHSYELLFVRKNEAGEALISTWISEMESGGDQRLAFLRAYYLVKPRLCVLPISWLAEIREKSQATVFRSARRRRSPTAKKSPLARVEVAPGRFVKCDPNDAESILESYNMNKKRR